MESHMLLSLDTAGREPARAAGARAPLVRRNAPAELLRAGAPRDTRRCCGQRARATAPHGGGLRKLTANQSVREALPIQNSSPTARAR